MIVMADKPPKPTYESEDTVEWQKAETSPPKVTIEPTGPKK